MSEELAYDLFSRGMLGVLHQTLGGVKNKNRWSAICLPIRIQPKATKVRGIIKGGKLNLATSIETQMTRMKRGKIFSLICKSV